MIFDFISIACGGYILITWFKLRIAGRLFPNSLLIPKDKAPKDCLDAPGYIAYIGPRMLIFGIPVLLFGVISLINEYVQFYGLWVAEGMTFATLGFIIWYAVCTRKAVKMFW